ncbi:MAG TPA: hypothetical protein ENJ95_01890, partial [Bacteroidetes bacterium]|nr:hypothetical protein [Bacteroidota bacterium]
MSGTVITSTTADNCLIFVSNSDGSVSCASGDETQLEVFFNSCPAPPVFDGIYCYDNNETNVVAFEFCPGATEIVNAEICQGSFETTYDDLTIYEGAMGSGTGGTIVFGPADGDLSGTLVSSTTAGNCLIFISNSDGSNSCASGGQIELRASFNTTAPPSCPDPTNLMAGNFAAGSADISWNAVTGATSYNWEIQNMGDPQGTMPAIASGSGAANSATAMGAFVDGNDYTLYVQADCGGGGTSNYVSLNFTFLIPPANDDCDGALSVTANPDQSCGNTTSGTVEGATASPEDPTACGGTEDDDVWFSFVATSTIHTIDLLNAAGSTTDLYHSLWEGTCPGGLTLVAGTCSDPNSQTVTGLTIGNTYYIRVYTWTATSGQNTTFDVCVGTPPAPPANDDCANAIAAPVNAAGTCGTTGTTVMGTTANATGATEVGSCDFGGDFDVFYSFVAPTSGAIVLSEISAAAGLEATVFDMCGG